MTPKCTGAQLRELLCINKLTAPHASELVLDNRKQGDHPAEALTET